MAKTRETEKQVDNRIELAKYTADVHGRVKDDVTADYTLAVLTEKQRENIAEMVNNAFLSKSMIESCKEAKKWTWNDKEKQWELKEQTEEEKQKIQLIAEATFDIHLTRINMITILNRNVANNPIMNILSRPDTETEEEPEKLKETVKENMKPE